MPRFPAHRGKLAPAELRWSVLSHLGSARRDLRVRPGVGLDVGVLELPGDRALVVTTDPLYVDPALGWKDAAWFAFHILASDLTTCGSPPQFLTLDLNLPPSATGEEVSVLMSVLSAEAKKLGASILTGHTGRYESCAYPIVGGATFGAIVPREGYVTAGMARPGDRLLLTKGPALESTVLLARMFPERVERELGDSALRTARRDFSKLSTVKDAMLAATVGLRGDGVWAMHDATEGGVRGAVEEMAIASGLGLDLDLSQAAPDPSTARLCQLFGLEPLSASSEGSLLVAVDPTAVDEVVRRWRRAGIDSRSMGTFGAQGGKVTDRGRRLPRAAPDGFWPAVVRARRRRD